MSTQRVVKKINSSMNQAPAQTVMQQSLNNPSIVTYSFETAKLLCSNDKVTVRELWLEVPVVDIYVAHLKRLNLDELKTDTLDRLETLRDIQKRKKEEERVI